MVKRTLTLWTLCLTLVLGSRPAVADLRPGTNARTLDFDGETRTYTVHAPQSYDGSTSVPLVLDFHGFTSNAAQQAVLSGFVELSETEGFIVAHPNGIDNAWNAGICCGNADVDDVGFVRALVGAINAEASIDVARVYATGLSNGGAMSQRLACDAADLIAAAAPLAFPLPFRPLSGCRPARPIPVLTFMGLTDVLVPYEGGLFPSALETFAYWRDINGCGPGSPEETVTSGLSRCESYTTCDNGVRVGLCSITARSFGGTFFDGHILYLNDDMDLAEIAWAFLSRFALPQPGLFQCYKVRQAGSRRFLRQDVVLADEFEVKDTSVVRPMLLCNPVATGGEEIDDPSAHRVCYRIKVAPGQAPLARQDLVVEDQFGELTLTMRRPDSLCVPSDGDGVSPALADRFKCYTAKVAHGTPGFQPRPAMLEDRFGRQLVRVLEPVKFCTPVDVNGDGIKNSVANLTCYNIAPQDVAQNPAVVVTNEFGEHELTAVRRHTFCVPSTKRLASPSGAFLEVTGGILD